MAKSLTQYMQQRNAMQLRKKGPGDPPKTKKALTVPKGSNKDYTFDPNQPADLYAPGKTKGRTGRVFRQIEMDPKDIAAKRRQINSQISAGTRPKESKQASIDSLYTEPQSIDMERRFRKQQVTNKIKKAGKAIKEAIHPSGKATSFPGACPSGQKKCK